MNTAELQTLARAATPGPWRWELTEGDDTAAWVIGFVPGDGFRLVVDECDPNDSAFIAACDPRTVLVLTEAVEAARHYLDGHDRRGDKLRDALAEIEVAA